VREIEYPQPRLEDGVIVLRPKRSEDIPALVAACQDPQIPRFTRVPDDYGEAEARAWLKESERQRRQGNGMSLLAWDAETAALVGSVGLNAVDWVDLRANIGYWSAADARGRGVATRATRMLARWTLHSLGMQRVQIYADVVNLASQRVAARAGFTREGILRSHMQLKGKRFDAVVFSLLPADLEGAAK
jgi:RimJ/RimL family protein N-acetyltransferase